MTFIFGSCALPGHLWTPHNGRFQVIFGSKAKWGRKVDFLNIPCYTHLYLYIKIIWLGLEVAWLCLKSELQISCLEGVSKAPSTVWNTLWTKNHVKMVQATQNTNSSSNSFCDQYPQVSSTLDHFNVIFCTVSNTSSTQGLPHPLWTTDLQFVVRHRPVLHSQFWREPQFVYSDAHIRRSEHHDIK